MSYALPADLDLDCRSARSISFEKSVELTPDAAESYLFGSPADVQPTLGTMLKAYPHVAPNLLRFIGSVMISSGPFLMSEKFLMAAYAARLNGSLYCCCVYESAAITLGVSEELLRSILYDIESSSVDPALKPCFQLIKTLVTKPWADLYEARKRVLEVGWSKRGLFDIITIAGLFSMMARIVNGCGLVDSVEMYRKTGQMVAMEGFVPMSKAFDLGVEEQLRAQYCNDATAGTFRPACSNCCSATRSAFQPERTGRYVELKPGRVVRLNSNVPRKQRYMGELVRVLEFVPAAGHWRAELRSGLVLRIMEDECVSVSSEEMAEFGYQPPEVPCAEPVAAPLADGGVRVHQPYANVSSSIEFANISSSIGYATGSSGSRTGSASGAASPACEDLECDALRETICNALRKHSQASRAPTEEDELTHRFRIVHLKTLLQFLTLPDVEKAHQERTPECTHVYFKVRDPWPTQRKALFAKMYSKLYKERRRRMSVLILDGDAATSKV